MKKAISAISFAALLMAGCTKTGNTGPAGTNGTNGNANVKANVATLTITNWQWSSPTDYAEIIDSSITADIVSSGLVSVFISTDANAWTAIPATIWGTPSYSFTYNYGEYEVAIGCTNTSFTNSVYSPNLNVKIIAVSSSLRKENPNTNWQDYDQVMTAVNQTPKMAR